jgi:hypothetical protein
MNELRAALEAAGRLPDGDAKVAELERITAHADAAEDTRLAFDARLALIDAYGNHTERWRMLPAFGWCLAAFDRDPSMFSNWDAEMLRWYHKWAVATLRATPRVGLAQTTAALSDMERRYREGGHSLHAIYSLRCRIADHLGDSEEARRCFRMWRIARRDENSDCAGCDPSRQAEHLAEWGQWAEAVEVVEPVLSGTVGCAEQPEKALAVIQVPYLHLGRHDEAATAHIRAYRRHRYERDAFPFLPQHLMFCLLSGNVERGLSILEEHLPWLERPYDDYSAMEFAAVGAALATLARKGGIERPGLDLDGLAAGLAGTARRLATEFDQRNGTGHQSERIAGWLVTVPIAPGVPLPADDLGREEGAAAALPPEGRQDLLAPLSKELIVGILDERGDRYLVDDEGTVAGRWGGAVIHFDRAGQSGEMLHIRAIPDPRFQPERRRELYEFCNAWNHDRLLPKVYVHDLGDELLVAGEVTTDLEHGVSARQLAVIIGTAISASAALADSLGELPGAAAG